MADAKQDDTGSRTGTAILLSVVAALGGFLFGFDTAVINGAVDAMSADFSLSPLVTGFTVSIALLGCAVGAWFAGPIADRIGRPKTTQNTVRFAWWGAEELGLIGSTEWVEQRTPEELEDIALYLNFDMIGSPNYYLGVYDADQSSFQAPVEVPAGSEAIEATFESFYTLRGEPYDDSAYSGRSDYQAFIENGIPAGGLFTGAEVVKTPSRPASGAVPRASSSTRATTWPATRSRTTTSTRST